MWLAMLIGRADAGPTIAQMNAATWRQVAQVERAELGAVSVLTATVAGVDCFRGVATAELPAAELFDVILDIGSAHRWSTTGVTSGAVLHRTGRDIVYHQYLDVPGWTLSSDRYWYLHGQIKSEDHRFELAWDRVPVTSQWNAERERFAATHPDAVEPPINVGSWLLVDSGGTTTITYSVCTQAGGSIPVALQNAASRRTLPDNLADAVREARRR